MTCFVAVIAIFVLPDFPSNSETWLSPLEKRLAEKRMVEDTGLEDQKETEPAGAVAILVSAFTDWKLWFMAFTFSSFFSLATFGYTDTNQTETPVLSYRYPSMPSSLP